MFVTLFAEMALITMSGTKLLEEQLFLLAIIHFLTFPDNGLRNIVCFIGKKSSFSSNIKTLLILKITINGQKSHAIFNHLQANTQNIQMSI